MARLPRAVLVLLLAALMASTTMARIPSRGSPRHISWTGFEDAKTRALWERHTRNRSPKPRQDVEYRLDESVIPRIYDLTVTPYLDNEGDKSFTYEGNVVILAEVASDTPIVTFHSYLLVIDSATISVQRNGNDVVVESAAPTDLGNEFYVVTLAETLTVGDQVRLSINYSGLLQDDMDGFYRSSYKDNGATKWLAVTDMEPTNARKAFPCFDEPQLKALWNINIRVPAGYQARANTPLLRIENDGDRDVYRFTTTPPMSSYLVCFIVSQFESTSAATDEDHKVWSRPSAEAQRSYAADLSPEIIRRMQEWTNISFTLPKIDQLAIPDYSTGAMENWGLITYREALILYDEEETPSDYKQYVCAIIAHEYAHQWFGDLVTLPWWSILWLNEGFATYFEYHLSDLVEPDMRFVDQFVPDVLQPSLAADASLESPPMTRDPSTVLTPRDDLPAVFDSISYGKSGSVLRMFDNILGREVFQGGLQNYLDKLQFGSGSEDVMFAAWEALVSPDQLGGFSITEIAKSWINTPGFPLLRVQRDSSTNTMTITQERFLVEGTTTEEPAWIVPINWATQGDSFADTKAAAWLNKSNTLTIEGIPLDSWVILNNQATGFYRVDYDAENWALIINQLNTDYSVIDVRNQAQLIDDAFNLALVGLNYTTALDLTVYLQNQQDYLPWTTAYDNFHFLNTRLYGTTYYEAFRAYVQKVSGPLFERFSTFEVAPNYSHTDRLLQNVILTLNCLVGNPACSERANTLFRDFMTGVSVPADVRSVVYCEALKGGGAEEWNFLWQRYHETTVASEEIVILQSLGCTTNTTILAEYMVNIINPDSGIRLQDYSYVYTSIFRNPQAFNTTVDFLRDEIIDGDFSIIVIINILYGLSTGVTTQEQADELIALGVLLGNGFDQLVQSVTEPILQWIHDNQEEIGQWLTTH